MSAVADVKMNTIPSFIIDPPTPLLSRVESNFTPEPPGCKKVDGPTTKLQHFNTNNNYKKKLLLAAAISNHSLLNMTNNCVPTTIANSNDLSRPQHRKHQVVAVRCNQDNSITTTKSPQNCPPKRFYYGDDLSPPAKRQANFASLLPSTLLPNSSSLAHDGSIPATTTTSQSDWLTNYRVATLISPLEEVMPLASPLDYGIPASKPLDLALKTKIIDLPACPKELNQGTVHKISAKSKAGEDLSPSLDFPQIPLLNSSPRLIEKAKGYWKEFITKVLDASKEEEEQEIKLTAHQNQLQTANFKQKHISSTTLTTPIDSVKITTSNGATGKALSASPAPQPNQFLVSSPSGSPSKNHLCFDNSANGQLKFQDKQQAPPLADQLLHHPFAANAAALYYYQQQQQHHQYLMSMLQQRNLLEPATSFLSPDLASALYNSSPLLTTANPYYYMLARLGPDAISAFQTGHHYPPLFDLKHLPLYPNPASGTNRGPLSKHSPTQQLQQPNPTPNPVSTTLPSSIQYRRGDNNVLHAHLTQNTVVQQKPQQQHQKQSFFDYHHGRTAQKLSPVDDSLSHLSSTYSGPYSSNKSGSSVCGDEKYPPAKQDPYTSPNDVLTNDSAVDLTFNEEEGHRKSNSSSKDSYLECGEALNLSKKRELPSCKLREKNDAYSTRIKSVIRTSVHQEDRSFAGKKEKMDALSALEKDKLEALALYNKLAETSSNEGVMTDADKNMVRQWNGTEDFLWEDVKYRRKPSFSTTTPHNYNTSRKSVATKSFVDHPNGLEDQQQQENDLFNPYDLLDDENELEDCKTFQAQHGRPCNKDQRMALALSLPFSIEDIVTSPIDSFSEIMRKADLSIEQIGLVRDIRRRGKNKIAAQNCRRRKLDLIMYLGKNVDYLKATRSALFEEREELEKEIIDYHIKLENLYLETFKTTKESSDTGPDCRIIPENYMFQFVDKSSGNLTPQKSNMPAYAFTWEKNLRVPASLP